MGSFSVHKLYVDTLRGHPRNHNYNFSIDDPNQRSALEAQIMEFGQTPKQLFTSPHPPRGRLSPENCPLVNPAYQQPQTADSEYADKFSLGPTINEQLLSQKSEVLVSSKIYVNDRNFLPRKTRMHSSRMRTARTLTVHGGVSARGGVCPGGFCWGVCPGGCLPGGVPAQGGVSAQGSAWGGVCPGGCTM